MSREEDKIPTLTDVVAFEASGAPLSEEELADLRTDLTASVFQLAHELMQEASREIEGVLFERVLDRLRVQLPELIEQVLKDRLIK